MSAAQERLKLSAKKLAVVTPDDNTDLTTTATALWVGTGGGNVAIIAADDSLSVTITGVPAGTLLPIAAKRVKATGTTVSAGNLIALY